MKNPDQLSRHAKEPCLTFSDGSILAVGSRYGSALLTVVMFVAVMAMVLGTLSSVAVQRIWTIRIQSDRIRALAIAEAGANMAFGLLVETPALADTQESMVISNFAGGTFAVAVTHPTQDVLLVTSRGIYREQMVIVAATVNLYVPTPEGPGGGLEGSLGALMLLSGGDLILSGGVHAGLGNYGAHCNGNLTLSGGPSISAASLAACGTVTLSGNPQVHLANGSGRMHGNGLTILRGTVNAGVVSSTTGIQGDWGTTTGATNIAPVVTWPNWFNPMPPIQIAAVPAVEPQSLPELNVDAFRALATDNAWYYDGNQSITRGWLTSEILRRTGVNVNNNATLVAPQGGVMFVNGRVTIASDMRFEGVLFATDNITISGAAQFSNPTPFPNLVSINGDIVIAGGASGPTLSGWIYAMTGSITAGGGASGCGMVAAQTLRVTGGYEVGAFEGGAFLSPGQSQSVSGASDVRLTLLSWVR